MFDTGLSSRAQMDFKHAMCKDAFTRLVNHINLLTENYDYKQATDSDNDHYYGGLHEPIENQKEQKEEIKKLSWKKRIGEKVGVYLPKLKTYLSAKKTLISSIAKIYGVQEKVSEVLGFLGVGITMMEPTVKAINAKEK